MLGLMSPNMEHVTSTDELGKPTIKSYLQATVMVYLLKIVEVASDKCSSCNHLSGFCWLYSYARHNGVSWVLLHHNRFLRNCELLHTLLLWSQIFCFCCWMNLVIAQYNVVSFPYTSRFVLWNWRKWNECEVLCQSSFSSLLYHLIRVPKILSI